MQELPRKSNVLLVGQDLMNCIPRPEPAEVSADLPAVQVRGDFRFGFTVGDERVVDLANDLLLFRGPLDQDHAVGLETLAFTDLKQALGRAGRVDQHPPEPEAGVASLLVSPNHPSDYTTMCIEDTFYPNSLVFPLTNPDPKGKPKIRHLHLQDDAAEVASLKAQGWKVSKFPVSGSGNKYEEDRRALDFKWEPIVRRVASKRALSLHEPFLVLHAIPRHNAVGRVNYAAVVTVAAPKFEGDLYDAVLRYKPALQPIRLRTESEIRVKI